MNNTFKSSDLLQELAPSQGEAVTFVYFSHMSEKINLIRNWDSPVAGKFGHLQDYLQKASFVPIELFDLYVDHPFPKDSTIFVLLPSFEDFRAFALAEYVISIDKVRGEWGKIARSLRSDYVRGFHYFVIYRILCECGPWPSVAATDLLAIVRDITDIFMKNDEVTIGRKGFGHLRSGVVFRPLIKYGCDPEAAKSSFNEHARRFTALPYGPLVSDIEHVFRINSIHHD